MADSATHAWDLSNPTVKIAIGKLVIDIVLNGEPIPDTPEGRVKMLQSHGISFTGPVEDVEMHQSTPTHMHLVLPPKEFLKKGFDLVLDSTSAAGYRVPPQYADFELQNQDALDPLTMYFFRIGDYSLSHCK